jgi:hypothetical protein
MVPDTKELDKVFCFGCKLFTKGHRKGQLANEGYNDWILLGLDLKSMRQVLIMF